MTKVLSVTKGSSGASGTVTSVSVTSVNGVSGTVATATTTPAISLTLGAITPTSIGSTTTSTTQTPADNSTKLATTAYVDNAVLGQDFKQAVSVATTGVLATYVYNNGSSGVGATITAVATGVISFDGTALTAGMRVLVKNETSTNTPNNGIYTVTVAGAIGVALVLTRATDFDQLTDIDAGDSVFVTNGTAQSTTTWAYNGITGPTIGTTNITFAQTAGQGSFTSGNGITITGNSVAINTAVTASTVSNLGFFAATTSAQLAGVISDKLGSGSLIFSAGTLNVTSGKTLAASNTLTLAGTDSTTMTFPSTSAIIARTDSAQTLTGINTFSNGIITTPQAITVTSNAGTADVTHGIQNFTNSSAATMTITLATSGAVDGQKKIVRIYDFSAVAEAITWVNTENSQAIVPGTSNGSTTLPLSIGFMYNSSTSKWRCLAVS